MSSPIPSLGISPNLMKREYTRFLPGSAVSCNDADQPSYHRPSNLIFTIVVILGFL